MKSFGSFTQAFVDAAVAVCMLYFIYFPIRLSPPRLPANFLVPLFAQQQILSSRARARSLSGHGGRDISCADTHRLPRSLQCHGTYRPGSLGGPRGKRIVPVAFCITARTLADDLSYPPGRRQPKRMYALCLFVLWALCAVAALLSHIREPYISATVVTIDGFFFAFCRASPVSH